MGRALQMDFLTIRAGPADYRGVSLDLSASLPGARQRPCLRTCLHVPGEGDGYPRSTDLSSIAGAKWHCGTSDWHTASRVLGPNGHLRRGAPTPNSFRVCRVLQSRTYALGITERCAATASSSAMRDHCRYGYFVRAASSVRADMIFGKDRQSLRSETDLKPGLGFFFQHAIIG
jgi:hypothetical protein